MAPAIRLVLASDERGQKGIQWQTKMDPWHRGSNEGDNKSQRGLVAAILEERGGGRKEIRDILASDSEGGNALGQQHKNRNGGRC